MQQIERRRDITSIIVMIVSLACILVALITEDQITWKVTEKQICESLESKASQKIAVLKEKINGRYSLLHGLAGGFDKKNTSDKSLIVQKMTTVTVSSDFIALYYVEKDGTAYRHTNEAKDMSEMECVKEALKGNDSIEYVSAGELEDKALVCISVPVSFDDAIRGALIGCYDLQMLETVFEESKIEESSFSFLCDINGNPIIANNATVERLLEIGDKRAEDTSSDVWNGIKLSQEKAASIQKDMENRIGGSFRYFYNDIERFALYQPTGINDWYIITVIDYDVIDSQASEQAKSGHVLLLVVSTVILLSLIILVRQEKKRFVESEKEAERLQEILDHDDLTGLIELNVFENAVKSQLEGAEPDTYCLVYVDIYKFKLINEMFGREKGDEVLCRLAENIKGVAKKYGGYCTRISGDQYAAFFPYKKEILDTLKKEVSCTKIHHSMDVYAHFGVYIIENSKGYSVMDMIDCAKIAQRTVKGNYDSYFAIYDEELKEQMIREQELINAMEPALENHEFVVFLQPQYNYETMEVCGAEALVRWMSPTKGMISPGEFVPIFERNGFINRVDKAVWEQVCQLLRRWLDEGRKVLPISVNVSRADIYRGSVAEYMIGLVEKYNLSPELLRIEITESAYIDNPNQLVSEIAQMREYGFTVEMDDFGSGYSSLNMLKDIPINVLKTDLRFLDSVGIGGRRDQILNSVIDMAHQIGLHVVAEGVETKEQADYLLDLECHTMQGFYFSRPIPINEYERIVYPDSADE